MLSSANIRSFLWKRKLCSENPRLLSRRADAASQKAAWQTLGVDLPWLNRSHRTLVAMASGILGRLMDGEDIGVKALHLLRMMINSMGGTPSDASKVAMAEEREPEDVSAKYFS
jgi:hypothetical protein